MVDKHVVKMILESAQLLSTAHRILDGKKEIKVINTLEKSSNFILKYFVSENETDTLYME